MLCLIQVENEVANCYPLFAIYTGFYNTICETAVNSLVSPILQPLGPRKRERERELERETERKHTDGPTNRDRDTQRETGRQTDRQTKSVCTCCPHSTWKPNKSDITHNVKQLTGEVVWLLSAMTALE